MTRIELLAGCVRSKHAGQLIKYTDQPYFEHLQAVAEMAGPLVRMGYELGLCHDLFEKTNTEKSEFEATLRESGYNYEETACLLNCTLELTDVYTKSAYPHMPKTIRKEKEASRLSGISAEAQTVKYADLIYNINWMLQHERIGLLSYLERKRSLINMMHAGHPQLRMHAMELIVNAISGLK